MGTDVVGSKMPTFASEQTQQSNRGYGQNGYGGPSSLTPAQARKVSKTYSSLATDTMNVTVNPGDWQTRKIDASPIKAARGMKRPDNSAKVPTTLLARSVPPSLKPTKSGNMKR